MGKRFTETNKWGDKWFRTLLPDFKLAWYYVCDYCDVAGVIEVDQGLAEFQIGTPIDWEAFLVACEGRIERLESGKYWIVRFVEFQYVTLSRASRVHSSVIRSLEKHGLDSHPAVAIEDDSSSHRAVRSRITRKYRDEIYALDEFSCQCCGHQFAKHDLTLDHLVGVHAGGTNEEENLYTFCRQCNSRKSQLDVGDFLLKNEIILPENRLSKFLKSLPSGLQSITRVPETLKDKEKDKDKEKEERGTGGKQRFVKPALIEVQAFVDERGSSVDVAKWYSYYESNGWKVGRNPMRDWKAAVRTWEGNDYNQQRAGPATSTSHRELAKQASLARKSNGNG